jgi:hypothetical protein
MITDTARVTVAVTHRRRPYFGGWWLRQPHSSAERVHSTLPPNLASQPRLMQSKQQVEATCGAGGCPGLAAWSFRAILASISFCS